MDLSAKNSIAAGIPPIADITTLTGSHSSQNPPSSLSNKSSQRRYKRKMPESTATPPSLSCDTTPPLESEEQLNFGMWTPGEHKKFLKALTIYGNQWSKVQKFVGTRTCVQIRSHAQKFFDLKKRNILKELKKDGKDKSMIFLVAREYRNLNHIIQKNPLEILLDPEVSSQRKLQAKKLDSAKEGSLVPLLPEASDVAKASPLLVAPLENIQVHYRDEPEGPILSPTTVWSHLDVEDSKSMQVEVPEPREPNYLPQENSLLPFIIADNPVIEEEPEIKGFLSKISYEY